MYVIYANLNGEVVNKQLLIGVRLWMNVYICDVVNRKTVNSAKTATASEVSESYLREMIRKILQIRHSRLWLKVKS